MKALPFSIILIPTLAFASPPDVPQESWFSETVSKFSDAGYFSDTDTFRPSDNATRAEFIQLIVELKGGVTNSSVMPNNIFDDVSDSAYFRHFQEAAIQGWLQGVDNCVTFHTEPCLAKPLASINRAEASALIHRAFNLQPAAESPEFSDNPSDAWFNIVIRDAASRCILQGDDGVGTVRPADHMNRAEMVVMLDRYHRNLQFPNCIDAGASYSLTQYSQPKKEIQKVDTSLCSGSAWSCSPFGECTSYGLRNRSCRIVDHKCTNPDAVKPSSQKHCALEVDEKLIEMRKRIDKGDLLIEDMEKEAWKMVTAFANQVFDIQYSFSNKLNEYKDIYNGTIEVLEQVGDLSNEDGTCTPPSQGTHICLVIPLFAQSADVEQIERELDSLEKNYYGVDRIYCRGDSC